MRPTLARTFAHPAQEKGPPGPAKRRLQPILVLLLLACSALPARADCFDLAEQRYGIRAPLLRAIASAESNNRANAVHSNRDGSVDLGVMQVNSSHLPQLSVYGIERRHLLDACTSIMVGAWLLAQNMQRYGPTWRAVGAYNAGQRSDREASRARYVRKVLPLYESQLRPPQAYAAPAPSRAPAHPQEGHP